MGRRNLFAYVGLMGVQEGLEYAMRALHELEYGCGRHDIAVVLMRDGADAPALHTLAHHLGLDDIICYLTVTDIGLSPVPQNAPNDACTLIKTMVYMVIGKSAVAFDLRETHCSDGEAGLYATPNLVEDFADTIEVLFDNHELRRTMGHLGRIGVEEELNWKHPTEHLLVAYGTLLSSAHSRHASAASAQVHQEVRSVA
ncbi:MAG: hypothetical protein ACXWQ5_12315 [Ktedonobacterales bacterium]